MVLMVLRVQWPVLQKSSCVLYWDGGALEQVL